jgi:hypothetical protein
MGGMAMGAPVPQGVTLVSTSEPLLRPSFIAGGSDIVYQANKDPNAEIINRLAWASFRNYSWEANEQSDNPFYSMETMEFTERFKHPLFGEDYMQEQCVEACEQAKTLTTLYDSVPNQAREDGRIIFQDTTIYEGTATTSFHDPIVGKPSEETNEEFHDVYLPAWGVIPESDPLEQFTLAPGSQFDDLHHVPKGQVEDYWWETKEGQHQYIVTTLT